jgi:hypothetical protein
VFKKLTLEKMLIGPVRFFLACLVVFVGLAWYDSPLVCFVLGEMINLVMNVYEYSWYQWPAGQQLFATLLMPPVWVLKQLAGIICLQ